VSEKRTIVWLEIQFANRVEKRAVTSELGAKSATAAGACPGCGTEPFLIQGSDRRTDPNRSRDQEMANGRCIACGDAVGYIYARHDTIFGLEEDKAIIDGRARVYG
jgi:hypothetical protein